MQTMSVAHSVPGTCHSASGTGNIMMASRRSFPGKKCIWRASTDYRIVVNSYEEISDMCSFI